MTRFRSLTIALVALALSAGAAFAFTSLPDAADDGIDKAEEMSGRTLPARPDEPAGPPAEVPPVDLPPAVDLQVELAADAADLPDAAEHGAAVSEAAKPADPPADKDHGSDVSEVARDNPGAAAVEDHKPADAGPPADAGQPDDPGPPDSVELPDAAPEDPGPPADPGQPAEPGRPN